MKKIKYLMLASMLLFTGMISVHADDNLTPDNIANDITNLNLTLPYCDAAENNTVKAEYNENKITLKCKKSGEDQTEKELIHFEYKSENQNLEYKKAEEESGLDAESTFTLLDNVLEVVLKESGHTDMSLPATFDDTESGFKLEVESAPAQSSFTAAKDAFIRQGKVIAKQEDIKTLTISLEKSKIDSFVTKVGDKYVRKLMGVKPALASGEITHNSVSISPTVQLDGEEIAEGYTISCYLYRATSDTDDDYSLIAIPQNCLTGATITDEDVDPVTTYYYKIQLVGSDQISDTLTVTTAAAPVIPDPEPTPDDNTNVTPDNTIVPDGNKENPNTGAFIPVTALSIFTIGGAVIFTYTMKKNKFKKI